jgi:hypothetical protein
MTQDMMRLIHPSRIRRGLDPQALECRVKPGNDVG